MRSRGSIYAAFTLSGVAGLAYEVLWSRYLALYVGHGALAQVLVLVVYLGGMGVGGLAAADFSRRIRRPLRAYAALEATLAVAGFLFHPVFEAGVAFSYDTLFPQLANPGWVGAAQWGMAGLLVLPPAILLGATFPFMAAALVGGDRGRPGRGVATAYLANTFGGAAGVLVAGFVLIPALGFPGAMASAALLNLVAAALAWWGGAAGEGGAEPSSSTTPPEQAEARPTGAAPPAAAVRSAPPTPRSSTPLLALLLAVAFGTAAASFAYEVAWIRMLSLVLGSATHAFELMLSAFILGLGLGALLIRNVLDGTPAPLRALGGIQWFMGLAALATLPVYLGTFEAMGALVGASGAREGGYLLVTASRYGLALAVMLPAAVLAGMVLPAITGILLRAGAGDEAIGWVYGVNTLGAVVGAALAGIVLLPALGLKGLVVAGAGLDMALGVGLLALAARAGEVGPRGALLAGVAGMVMAAGALGAVRLDPRVLTSGVYRYGSVPASDDRTVLFYRDGRTSSVGVHLRRDNELLVLTTNGKPDASLTSRWLAPRRDTLRVRPLDARDLNAHILMPVVALAYRPDARRMVNIGHGSGMSGAVALASPHLEELVTVEIEPAVVEASQIFLQVNGAVFTDARSSFVLDDARAYLAQAGAPFDAVMSQPSNPWVGGTASLFTREFYRHVRRSLAPGGVLVQWFQLYETTDDLVLSVLAALGEVFPDYRVHVVSDADIVLVAGRDGPLPSPDWSVARWPGLAEGMLMDVPPFLPEQLDATLLLESGDLRELMDRPGVPPANSDYHSFLAAGAERAFFEKRSASGLTGLATDRFDLLRTRGQRPRAAPETFALPPTRYVPPVARRGLARWLMDVRSAGGGIPPEAYPEWQEALERYRDHLMETRGTEPPTSWLAWLQRFHEVEADVHGGTAGWTDAPFYDEVEAFLDRTDAPPGVRAAVALRRGVAGWDFPAAAAAADRLLNGDPHLAAVPPEDRVDGVVLAYLGAGRSDDARRALDALAPESGRQPGDLRLRLLDAWVRAAGS